MSPQAIADRQTAGGGNLLCLYLCASALYPTPGIWPSHHEKAISLYRIVAPRT